jgi:hypothetical protein
MTSTKTQVLNQLKTLETILGDFQEKMYQL